MTSTHGRYVVCNKKVVIDHSPEGRTSRMHPENYPLIFIITMTLKDLKWIILVHECQDKTLVDITKIKHGTK